MFKALGVAPTSINSNELFRAADAWVDGQESPLVIISLAKLYEVEKILLATNHMWDGSGSRQ